MLNRPYVSLTRLQGFRHTDCLMSHDAKVAREREALRTAGVSVVLSGHRPACCKNRYRFGRSPNSRRRHTRQRFRRPISRENSLRETHGTRTVSEASEKRFSSQKKGKRQDHDIVPHDESDGNKPSHDGNKPHTTEIKTQTCHVSRNEPGNSIY
ncbi:hypothetical protein HG535_0B00490 [Zygotorulaspora mrakii]|uniref:Uncharacterized protein n=1 Tax=Zygotorulaspora mrakii TaxID=42260 RepID=A0A7H9AXJ5_ZYGMR|nr:uncharacterized protein HG535_0B00490 [Zygotorulaspora mrakii]QLG71011.1 hypothetical protein HG535_0B00490 [Zygotorulaspora mrakii]